MTNSARIALASLVAAAALAAGCGPPYIIVRQAAANPLAQPRLVAVEPMVFPPDMRVGNIPEQAYLARKDPNQQQSWQIDKAKLSDFYRSQLVARSYGRAIAPPPGMAPPPGSLVLRAICQRIEPGNYFGPPTEVNLLVQIIDPQAGPLDEFQTRSAIGANAFSSVTSRLQEAGYQLGAFTASYLADRAAGR
jgi:hypothetical protein